MNVVKKCQETHPWINFSVDTRRFSQNLLMLLGEAQSKIRHIAGIALHPEDARELYKFWLIRGIKATTAIEGNTLTEEEIERILQKGEQLSKSKRYMEQEVRNVQVACNYCMQQVIGGGSPALDVETIKRYNAMVLSDIENLDDHVTPGEYRRVSVGVGTYRAPDPGLCDELMKCFSELILNQERFILWPNQHDDYQIATAIIQAVLAHLYLAWIHPFGDGNGRTARIMEMHILYRAGVSDAAGHLLSNHYNSTRQEYYRQLELTSKTQNIIPFLEYAIQGLVDGLGEHIKYIQKKQLETMWRDFVYTEIDNKTATTNRHAKLLIALGKKYPEPTTRKEIRHLSTHLAAAYANLTDRAISRDLNELAKKELLFRSSNKRSVYANIPRIRAFMPNTAS